MKEKRVILLVVALILFSFLIQESSFFESSELTGKYSLEKPIPLNSSKGFFISGTITKPGGGFAGARIYQYSPNFTLLNTKDVIELNAFFPENELQDIDGDKIIDVVYADPIIGPFKGRVKAYAGPTFNRLLVTKSGENAGDWFGRMLDVADLNKDKYADIIVGAWGYSEGGFNIGKVYVYSGKNFSELYSFKGPTGKESQYGAVGIRSKTDFNGDGYEDLIISELTIDPITTFLVTTSINVHSGKDGSLIKKRKIDEMHQVGDIDHLGDINRDGGNDFLVGMVNLSNTDDKKIILYSGKDHIKLYIITRSLSRTGCSFGSKTEVIQDLNADGYPDFIVGEPCTLGTSLLGNVYAYSGKDGSLLYTIPGSTKSFGNELRRANQDFDGDSKEDFFVGEEFWNNDKGKAYVYSSATGQLIQQINNPDPQNVIHFGNSFGIL